MIVANLQKASRKIPGNANFGCDRSHALTPLEPTTCPGHQHFSSIAGIYWQFARISRPRGKAVDKLAGMYQSIRIR
jgi:hypothetical protein